MKKFHKPTLPIPDQPNKYLLAENNGYASFSPSDSREQFLVWEFPMNTKYLKFVELGVVLAKKTKVFHVVSVQGEHLLGMVSFRPQWRKYVFRPEQDTIFDATCLTEIVEFCKEQTALWRKTQ